MYIARKIKLIPGEETNYHSTSEDGKSFENKWARLTNPRITMSAALVKAPEPIAYATMMLIILSVLSPAGSCLIT